MKGFLILLALLLLLFTVGVVLGARGEEGGRVSPENHPWLQRLGGILGARTAIDLAALDSPCRSGDVLAVAAGGVCRSTIPAADRDVRTLSLRLTGPSRAGLFFEPRGGASLPVRKPLAPAEEVRLTIPPEGGTLLLTCTAGGDCLFEPAGG